MNYEVMAADLIETLDELNIEHFSLIGHSMGGKLVMKVTELAGDRLDELWYWILRLLLIKEIIMSRFLKRSLPYGKQILKHVNKLIQIYV